MTRIALGVEYDGTDFLGWQTQRQGRTVQGVLDLAVSSVADGETVTHAAGRTDTGVHASYQVVHFDTRARRSPRQWRLGINSNLPDDVSVNWACEVPDEFDSRRSALARRYRYLVVHDAQRSALLHRRAWCVNEPLDAAAMSRGSTAFIGEQDFSAFRASGCQSASTKRFMSKIALRTFGNLLAFEFTANAFLYHMVRNLVGLLVEIGRGRRDWHWAREVLVSGDRTRAAVTAPAAGLSLVDIRYPEKFDLPAARETLFIF